MTSVSVIIPVYNAGNMLSRCLDSICGQLTEQDELLLVNDGSTDGSAEVIARYAERYPSLIRPFYQENAGAAEARNHGIREAKCDYICFLDQDDFVDPDYVSAFRRYADTTDADILLGGYRRVSENKTLFRVDPVDSPWFPFTTTAAWARIYRSNLLKKHDIRFLTSPIGEDVYLNLNAYAHARSIMTVPYTGYNWYFNSGSVSNTSQRGFDPRIDLIRFLNILRGVCGEKLHTEKWYGPFFVRYVIWYLLFSGRSASSEAFMREYKACFGWLAEEQIPIRFPIGDKDFSCERSSAKCSIHAFLMLHRLHLVPLFAKLYCRGGS
ncbi:MAG: glycosyltransferase family 2 protein [Eubacterium sp.]|nr:glycosyltransferase family 2 protein [Eubacterium sp.]